MKEKKQFVLTPSFVFFQQQEQQQKTSMFNNSWKRTKINCKKKNKQTNKLDSKKESIMVNKIVLSSPHPHYYHKEK